jgi:CXXX repeat peptide maturase
MQIYVICNSDFPSICEYATNKEIKTANISDETLNKVIDFCETNNFVPIFCGCTNLPKDYYAYQIVSFEDILSHKCRFHENYFTQVLLQVEDEIRIDLLTACVNLSNIIVSYKASQLEALSRLIIKLFNLFPQISINITMRQIDIVPEKYIERYNDFLKEMLNVIHKGWAEKKYFTLNVLTHELFANTNRSCGAGKNTYTMSPDGNIYLCPGFYYNDPENTVGSIDLGIRNVYSKYCDMDNAPLCNGCDIKHCSRCIFKNKIGTGEYHIPTEIQCVISHMEYNFSRQLTDRIKSDIASVPFEYNEKLRRLEDYDPLINIKGDDYPNKGYDLLVKKLTPPIMWR